MTTPDTPMADTPDHIGDAPSPLGDERAELNSDGARTQAFMTALLAGLAPSERTWLSAAGRTLLGWGCTQEQGVAELAHAFPHASVRGFDIAPATGQRAHIPSREFLARASSQEIFDAVVCGNCLAHSEDPQAQATTLATYTRGLLIVLVPYAEEPLAELHSVRVTEETFPLRLAALERQRVAVLDGTSSGRPEGRQLLMVYASSQICTELSQIEATEREKNKWDAYYESLPDYAIDAPTAIFNQEIVDAIKALLPAGGSVLEAGCGGGNQSVALAQQGLDVAVLDFSRQALDYAERQFARAEAKGRFIEDDAFAIREPEFDLVFNSGVLEHYTIEEQARFLRGMASRSRRYVMVLVPNSACYWYWIWRIVKTSREGWPFGKEVPTADLSAAFELAGLKYLGHCFMGASWTESFIQALPDCESTTRDLLCEIHRSGVIPDFSRGYLFAALGCIDESTELAAEPWRTNLFGGDPAAAQVVSALGDALAARLSADNALVRLTSERETLLQNVSEIAASLARLGEENQRLTRWLEQVNAQAAQLGEQVRQANAQAVQAHADAQAQAAQAHADAQILAAQAHTLEVELAQQRGARTHAEQSLAETHQRVLMAQRQIEEVSRWAHSMAAHPVRYALKRSLRGFARGLFRVLPLPTTQKNRLRRLYTRLRQGAGSAGQTPVASVAAHTPGMIPPPSGPVDVYVFGIIDWHFRIQRPQHLARELARRGHRVFFVSPNFVDAVQPGARFERLDSTLPLFQVHLNLAGYPSVYSEAPDDKLLRILGASLGQCLAETASEESIALVELAFWSPLARSLPNSHVIYDCMDHHEGFGGVAASMQALEQRLIETADLVVTTSDWLHQGIKPRARRSVLVRNAGDFQHFSVVPGDIFRDTQGRRVIGYFGAIAEWFDIELVERIAASFPDCLLLLIGNDTAGAGKQLSRRDNVVLLGELPYAELPRYLHGFSVCLLPFKVMPLTLATNPVKVYEYLAAGKPVVGTALPEMAQFGELVHTCADADAFLASVGEALAGQGETSAIIEARKAFAAANTWTERARILDEAIAALPAIAQSDVRVPSAENVA